MAEAELAALTPDGKPFSLTFKTCVNGRIRAVQEHPLWSVANLNAAITIPARTSNRGDDVGKQMAPVCYQSGGPVPAPISDNDRDQGTLQHSRQILGLVIAVRMFPSAGFALRRIQQEQLPL